MPSSFLCLDTDVLWRDFWFLSAIGGAWKDLGKGLGAGGVEVHTSGFLEFISVVPPALPLPTFLIQDSF